MSTACPKQVKKIKSIIDFESDIVFLSDLRLNCSPCVADLEKSFLLGNKKRYKFYYNSTKNSRGTGILISSNFDCVINYTFKDQSENILAINVSMGSQKINLISIYGTNRNDPVFFTDLCNFLLMYPDSPTILGGDWNATFCTTPGPDNIDIYRMANMPSLYM